MNPLIIIWLSFALWNNSAGEVDKSFFIQSILQDGFLCNGSFSQSEHCECIKSAYDAFTVAEHPAFEGEISISKIGRKIIYEVKIYELKFNNYSWKLLHYEDQNCSGWYRISGYKENDFIHLYNKVLHHYIPRAARCEAVFVMLSAANQFVRQKVMHKTKQREVYKK